MSPHLGLAVKQATPVGGVGMVGYWGLVCLRFVAGQALSPVGWGLGNGCKGCGWVGFGLMCVLSDGVILISVWASVCVGC